MDVNRGPLYLSRLFDGLNQFFFIRPLKNRLKTAQILLEKPFKNHRKKWAVFERFLSKIWAVWAIFPKNRPDRSNRSKLAGKPLKPLIQRELIQRELLWLEIWFFFFFFQFCFPKIVKLFLRNPNLNLNLTSSYPESFSEKKNCVAPIFEISVLLVVS